MTKEVFSSQHIEAAEALLRCINPDATAAENQIMDFRARLDSEEAEDDENVLWALNEIIQWKTGFFVDWKDTDSMCGSLAVLAELWGAKLEFCSDESGDEQFLNDATVADILQRAHAELVPQGLILWD